MLEKSPQSLKATVRIINFNDCCLDGKSIDKKGETRIELGDFFINFYVDSATMLRVS